MRKSKKFKKVLALVLGVSVLGFGYSYYESRHIHLRQYTLENPQVPLNFENFKIVFIADTHCNKFFSPTDFENLVNRINQLNADIVILGGDYTLIDPQYSKPFFETLKRIKAKYGIYSVFGNHDFWHDINVLRNGFEKANINICDNQSYWIKIGNDSIKIGGVGDLWEDQQIISNTIEDVKENNFCILLSHNPDYIEKMTIEEQNRINLMLSGHTHAGQVTLFGLYAPIMPSTLSLHPNLTGQKYRYGWKEVNQTKIYITSGIGVDKFPFRFFAAPEIVEITLKQKK